MSQKWEYNGVNLEVEMEDADFVDKYEAAFNKLEETEKKLLKVGTKSEIVRGYCDMFYALFDDLYGPGTSEKLFVGKRNAKLCDEAYGAFLDAVKADVEEAGKARISHIQKYYVAKPQKVQNLPNRNNQGYQNRRQRRRQGQYGRNS